MASYFRPTVVKLLNRLASRPAGNYSEVDFLDNDPDNVVGVAQMVWDATATANPTVIGMSAVSGVGAGAAVAGTYSAQGEYNLYQSGNTVTNLAGWTQFSAATTLFQLQTQPILRFKVWTGSTVATSVRIWVGVSTMNSAANLNTDTPGTAGFHTAAFRYSTVAGDTNWQAVTSDAVSQTVTDTLVPVTTTTRYRLRIDIFNTATIKFYINDNLVATHTANLPSTTTGMAIFSVAQTVALNTQRQLGVARWHIRKQQP